MLSYSGNDSTFATFVAGDLGIRLNCYMDVHGGGSSTEALIGIAIGVIEAGMCKTVAIYPPSAFLSGPSRGPGARNTPEPSPSCILRGLSRPRRAAPCRAARRSGRPLLPAGGAAMAAREGRPPAGNAGRLHGRFRGVRPQGDGDKMAFVLPIRPRRPAQSSAWCDTR
jgi:hypothetical protein